MKKIISYLTLTFAALLFLTGCGSTAKDDNTVTIGVMEGSSADIWRDVADRLAEEEITLKLEIFTDYTRPNEALASGDIDLNAFQHVAFLTDYNANSGNDLTPIGYTFVSPFGLYSNKLTSLDDFKDGDTITIPNDPTNGGRAIYLLETIGLIELVDKDLGASPTLADIETYNVDVTIEELDAAQLASSLNDVTAAAINTNYAIDAGLNPKEDALILDTDHIESLRDVYKNVIVARPEDAENELYLRVVEEYQTDRTAELIKEYTKGTDIPAW